MDDLSGNTSGADTYRLQMVLIPLGRCIQRHAAAPDFFRSPRIVVAADSETDLADVDRPVFIKDRLFLGYQREAQAIEVISYNELAGRFEFQVVEDYAQGRKPRARYARRAQCTACHQNEGPIFSRVRWGETTANRRIYEKLMREASPDLLAVFGRRSDQAYFADAATDRASMLPTYQKLWREVCASDQPGASVRCRAGAFEFALQHRLRGAKGTFPPSPHISEDFLPMSLANFRSRWPEGFDVPSADVPTRYPLHEAAAPTTDPALELLAPRPPKMRWLLRDFPRFIDGLAASIPHLHLKKLDEQLLTLGASQPDARRRMRGACELVRHELEIDDADVDAHCRFDDGLGGRSFDLTGDLYFNAGRVIPGNQWLLSSPEAVFAVRSTSASLDVQDDVWAVELELRSVNDGIHGWIANEGAIDRVRIEWRAPGPLAFGDLPVGAYQADLLIELVSGYDWISSALTTLIESEEDGGEPLFEAPALHAGRVMDALLETLGAEPPRWCCTEWATMSPVEIVEHTPHAPTPTEATERSERPVALARPEPRPSGVRERYE